MQGGFNVEGDFVESPSQMLEEMFHDTAILQSFGKQYQTGETLPASLIAKMNAASAYGRGRWLQTQLIYSSYSLQVHDMDPATIDFDALMKQDERPLQPFHARRRRSHVYLLYPPYRLRFQLLHLCA